MNFIWIVCAKSLMLIVGKLSFKRIWIVIKMTRIVGNHLYQHYHVRWEMYNAGKNSFLIFPVSSMTKSVGKGSCQQKKCLVKLMTNNVGIPTEEKPVLKDQVSFKVRNKLKKRRKKKKNWNFTRFTDSE